MPRAIAGGSSGEKHPRVASPRQLPEGADGLRGTGRQPVPAAPAAAVSLVIRSASQVRGQVTQVSSGAIV